MSLLSTDLAAITPSEYTNIQIAAPLLAGKSVSKENVAACRTAGVISDS